MKLHEKYKGAIFDLDGTILDSSWVWEQVDIKFLGDRGFEVPNDYVEAISPVGAYRAAASQPGGRSAGPRSPTAERAGRPVF